MPEAHKQHKTRQTAPTQQHKPTQTKRARPKSKFSCETTTSSQIPLTSRISILISISISIISFLDNWIIAKLCGLSKGKLHQPFPIDIPYDFWFRIVVLPIAAMEDGHLVAAISAVSLAIATGKLDLCIQSLFGAGKSRTAAILLSGLLVLDTDGLSLSGHLQREYRHQMLCPHAPVPWGPHSSPSTDWPLCGWYWSKLVLAPSLTSTFL